jgi:hypothetical protein
MLALCGMPNGANAPNNVAQRFALMHNITGVNELYAIEPKDVAGMMKLWNQEPQNAKIGMGIQKKVCAWVFWAAERRRRNLPVDMATWGAAGTMAEAMQAMAISESVKTREVPSELIPGKVETELGWYVWDEKFENYLAAQIGTANTPLDYVIRRDKPVGWDPVVDATNAHEERRYQVALAGPEFNQDDKAVYLKLKGFCLDTPAWEWIREFDRQMSGRNAMIALRMHYEGEGEVSKRIGVAHATLDSSLYRNEFTFSFERFSTRMKMAFTVLEKHGEPYAEMTKVKMLNDRIQIPNNGQIQIAKSNMMDMHPNNFNDAVGYMAKKVTEIFPDAFDADTRRDHRRKRNVSEARSGRGRGRPRRGGRRGRDGRESRDGGRTGNGGRSQRGRARTEGNSGGRRVTWMNGIDVTDVRRVFTDEEFQCLGASGRQ